MKAVSKVIIGIVYAFLYAPLLYMVIFSFNAKKSLAVFGGFSLKWYQDLFNMGEVMESLRWTLILAVLSALIATVFGTLAALGLYMARNKFYKQSMLAVTNIPMMNPDIVTGISLMLLFVFIAGIMRRSESLSFATLLIAHVTFNLPYVILNVLPKLNQTDKNLYEAAQDLGAPPAKAFFLVVIPQIVPGIISGALMSFTLSIDDFIISYFTAPAEILTLPLKIEGMTRKTMPPTIYALSTLMLITTLVLLLLINIIQSRSDKKTAKVAKP